MNLLAAILILMLPACCTPRSDAVHGADGNTAGQRGGTITREVPHSKETFEETRDNESRHPPTDNCPRVAPYPHGPPPVELPPFPNLPNPPKREL